MSVSARCVPAQLLGFKSALLTFNTTTPYIFMDITIKDLFCGCGGSSQGAKNVPGVHVKYAMNHWRLAVDSHNTNHPDTYHDCADISDTHPARYDRTTILIGSPECTNHSLAQGRRRKNLNQGDFFQQNLIDPAAVRSRATMWDIVRFAEVHRYEVVVTENVVDVRKWALFDPWLKAMHNLGYRHKCVYLNAQFAHGDGITGFAPQSRDRIYIVFWKKGNPEPDLNIRPKAPCARCGEVEAVQSWKNSKKQAGKYRQQYIYRCCCCGAEVVPYYYAAANCIDFSIPMIRIGDREKFGLKPLKETTVDRIKYGLEKYGIVPTVLDQRNQSGALGTRIRSAVSDPMNTQHTGFSSYLFSPFMVNLSFTHAKGDRSYGLNGTFPTQTTQESLALLSPDFGEQFSQAMTVTFRAGSVVRGGDHSGFRPYAANCLTEPLPTQVGMAQSGLLSTVPLMLPYYGKDQASLLTDSLPSVRTKASHGLFCGGEQPAIEDCYFRMLQPEETAAAQGFPSDYVILGSKEHRQKQIGNANPPPTMQLLVSRCVETLRKGAWA